jgi:hypothetical protein
MSLLKALTNPSYVILDTLNSAVNRVDNDIPVRKVLHVSLYNLIGTYCEPLSQMVYYLITRLLHCSRE